MKNKKREMFCDISYFMKQSGKGGCNGCVRSRKCEEWYQKKEIKIQKHKSKSKWNRI